MCVATILKGSVLMFKTRDLPKAGMNEAFSVLPYCNKISATSAASCRAGFVYIAHIDRRSGKDSRVRCSDDLDSVYLGDDGFT